MTRAVNWAILAGGVLLIAGCGGEPFPIVKVSGQLVYEDGSPLPTKKGDTLGLIFVSQTPPRNPATHPRTGTAVVNPEDGTFSYATTHKHGDGLIRGRHKVSIYTGDRYSPAVPRDYCDPDTTPLEIDVSGSPLLIRIRKP